jgi:hypothetical protein
LPQDDFTGRVIVLVDGFHLNRFGFVEIFDDTIVQGARICLLHKQADPASQDITDSDQGVQHE